MYRGLVVRDVTIGNIPHHNCSARKITSVQGCTVALKDLIHYMRGKPRYELSLGPSELGSACALCPPPSLHESSFSFNNIITL